MMGEADVMKSLQKLPGVQSSSDGAAGIYVRGGNYDQNLITLDGSTLYNGEHLKGFSSSIIPDMVDNVTFYKGAFPGLAMARDYQVWSMWVLKRVISKITTGTLTLVCFCQQFTPKVLYRKGIQVSTLPLEPPTSTGLCNLYLIRFTIIPTL